MYVGLVLAVLFPFLGSLLAQQPEKTSESLRKEYLEKFPWTLANTDRRRCDDAAHSRRVEGGEERRGGWANTGYGAINMGIGFERTGGRLTSIEIDPRTAASARGHLAKVGLDKVVTVVEGDALESPADAAGHVRLRVHRRQEAGLPESI